MNHEFFLMCSHDVHMKLYDFILQVTNMFSSQLHIYDYEPLLLLMNQKHVLQDYDKLSYETIQASYDS